MTENEAREYIRDYLNGIYTEKELMLKFEIVKCPNGHCNNYELEEDMEYRNYDLGGHDGKVCRGCSHE